MNTWLDKAAHAAVAKAFSVYLENIAGEDEHADDRFIVRVEQIAAAYGRAQALVEEYLET